MALDQFLAPRKRTGLLDYLCNVVDAGGATACANDVAVAPLRMLTTKHAPA